MNEQVISRKQLGALGEQYALEHLQRQGFRIAGQNWRCRTGELDLIAWDNEVLVIVEVRTRSSTLRFGTPVESVDYKKCAQVIETAQFYVHTHRLQNYQIRFDVISIVTDKAGNLVSLDQIPNAF
ncbi:YraN family protein [Paenibacillus sp. UNC451MF]|uniref:YraN family protein n=1 Tax=Paenibacillus sp. UNC451MF TaxID=1449063 RepID=UPI0004903411|nr:YraN family protein [Paenibacillus sp. UNC451MF]